MTPARVRIEVSGAPARGYDVDIGLALNELGAVCASLPGVARWAVIADATVATLYRPEIVAGLGTAGVDALWLEVAPGEGSKCRAEVARLQDEIIAAGIGRDGGVLAVGGGVTGDLAGFVAATLYRGIRWVQVPTTLLAMVDSSVGGKTGIDAPGGKNLVGAFHQPSRVIVDVGVLATLPQAEIQAGLAEVIKYGVIGDEQLFVDLEDGLLESCLAGVSEALESVVQRCVQRKAAVVGEDEREANLRQVLNFGHTVGHAVEAEMGYAMRHGEAVSIGMVVEARIAEQRHGAEPGLSLRVAELCERAGLPTTVPETCSPQAVIAAARRDKKARAGVLRCSLPLAIGTMARDESGSWSVAVSEADLIAALQSG